MGGATGTGGLSRGPTPPSNGTNFPFPQNRQMSGCIYPTAYNNNDVMAAYTKWKADLVVSDAGAGGFQRVQRTSTGTFPDGVSASTPANSTVSEGIGYGMLIAVYMGDHTLFDNLWKYSQLHLDSNGLMNWSISADGKSTPGMGAATDADEDIAWALAMADKQWGSSSGLNYLNLAKTQIGAIWNHEVYDSKLAGPGDGWGPTNLFNNINISYFAPAYYRLFKQLDGGHAWEAVTQTVYDTIFANTLTNAATRTPPTGSCPGGAPARAARRRRAPSTTSTTPVGRRSASASTGAWTGGPAASATTALNPARAQAYVALTSSFFSGVGAANIVDGYNLDGTVNSSAHAVSAGQSAAFIGPAGVGAMSSASYQSFLNASYNLVKTNTLLVGGAYYEECWTVMSLLMMTGNFLDYTQITPASP